MWTETNTTWLRYPPPAICAEVPVQRNRAVVKQQGQPTDERHAQEKGSWSACARGNGALHSKRLRAFNCASGVPPSGTPSRSRSICQRVDMIQLGIEVQVLGEAQGYGSSRRRFPACTVSPQKQGESTHVAYMRAA